MMALKASINTSTNPFTAPEVKTSDMLAVGTEFALALLFFLVLVLLVRFCDVTITSQFLD